MSQFVLKSSVERDVLPWGTMAWMAHPPRTGNEQLTVLDVELSPGEGHNFHKHPEQEEVIYVLEGEVEQWLEEEMKMLKPGDAVYIDADVVHASFNPGDAPVKLIAILSPCVGEIGYAVDEVGNQEPWASLR